MKSQLVIEPLKTDDFPAWVLLARGYKTFYKTEVTDKELSDTWERLLLNREVFGAGAKLEGQLVGIVHYLFHTTIWAPCSCYLQDLYTVPEARGLGVARQLVKYVAEDARSREADRLYWNTQEDNVTARGLYDKIARFNGFIRYDFPINN